MGGSQSGGEAEREVTVEEQEIDGGQPQIIVRAAASPTVCGSNLSLSQVTQDFLQYVHDKQQEEEGGYRTEQNKNPPPYSDATDELPHVTAEDLVRESLDSPVI